MSNYLEYVFKNDGTALRRTVTEETIRINEGHIANMAKAVPIKVGRLFEVPPWGRPYLTLIGGVHYYSFALEHLTLRAPFKLVDEKLMVPNFDSRNDQVLTMKWTPPAGLIMRFLVQYANQTAATCWLFAYDTVGAAYRLPLANLYDDCKLCTGQFNGVGDTVTDSLKAALTQLETSNWNRDLWRAAEQTQNMFRWEVKKDSSDFTCMLPASAWQKLCDKVSTTFSNLAYV